MEGPWNTLMTANNAKPPELPFFVAKPLSLLPKRIARLPTERALNFMFAAEIEDGNLEFLSHQVVTVNIDDMDLRFSLTLVDNRLRVLRAPRDGDLEISGTTYAFMQLAFFNRHGNQESMNFQHISNLLETLKIDG